ncbi:restriction endonuclease [Salinigranum rubrum]|uniref:Restriction endonuclease n=1 Tax=Salinigranum rubrum TaxID=755307 RepID=A0A2I8VEA1_9EURY|nr:restriction endonuclease [Salinigranum rubrum]AUV80258.1 restriction endonuclease [Salinigranum rubrum]
MSRKDGHSEHTVPSREYLLARLQQMDPERFEHLVADVWERLGWETRVVSEPGDRGIDVIATQGKETQLIQAKRYGPNTSVGSPEVQQYASLRLQEDGVDTVTIVTTGTFTEQAEDMAPDLGVILVDGAELLEVCEQAEAWPVLAGYFEELTITDGEAADIEPPKATGSDGANGALVGLATVWRIYKQLRRYI